LILRRVIRPAYRAAFPARSSNHLHKSTYESPFRGNQSLYPPQGLMTPLQPAPAKPLDEPAEDEPLDSAALLGEQVQVPLQKQMQARRSASRDTVRAWIQSGRVRVNGTCITRFAEPVAVDSILQLDDDILPNPPVMVLLMHKPRRHLTALVSPDERPTLAAYLPEWAPDVFAVGRLDFNSEGALLLTNDGTLAHRLLHPAFAIEKRYGLKIRDRIEPDDPRLAIFTDGIVQGGVTYRAVRVAFRELRARATWIDVWLNEGKNREIRRLAEAAGFQVVKLRRESIGPIALGSLNPRCTRALTSEELQALYRTAGLPLPAAFFEPPAMKCPPSPPE
jgi:23S rRNA pseudouridine2605 synthase